MHIKTEKNSWSQRNNAYIFIFHNFIQAFVLISVLKGIELGQSSQSVY